MATLIESTEDPCDKVDKVSIHPRSGQKASGITVLRPEKDQIESGMFSKRYLENKICVALGGRIAEEMFAG